MAYEILDIDNKVICVRIRGLMRLADQNALQGLARDLIEQGRKPRLLVVTSNFEGWEKNDGWDDVGFLMDYGDAVAKIAIVGDERWKEQAFMFSGKGLRATEIEFFPPSQSKEAELWIRV
ncbi:MAG: STAS/SEC14 domain-containing protein [Gammaproteobacteria bacterium]